MPAMVSNALRDLLNRLRWDAREQGSTVVLAVRVRRRGVEQVEEHEFSAVTEVAAGGVILADGTFLPFHRVVGVSLDGRVVWPQREGS